MSDEGLIGVRPADLDEATRARQAALLAGSAELRTRHEAALRLADTLRGLPPPKSGVTAADALRRASERRQAPANRPWGAYGLGVALAAAAAVVLFALVADPTEDGRDRGTRPGSALEVHLEAVAEGPLGVRALRDGARVGPDERVIFRVRAQGEGFLRLEEAGGTPIWPSAGATWPAAGGTHVPGGDVVASYRPDAGGGTLAYRVWFCPEANPGTSECATDAIELVWE